MKTLNIEIPKGYEIDQENSNLSEGKIVFKQIKKALPKTWEELGNIKGYYLTGLCDVTEVLDSTPLNKNRNIFATKELAEASIAMAQLSQLREVYRDGWKPNWGDESQLKYVIRFVDYLIDTNSFCGIVFFLSFQSPEIRDEFLNNFRDLIEKAKPLMS